MPLTREAALDILGLPTFASENDIILRYKALSLKWFPESHYNPKLALQTEMYGFFQYIFFGDREVKEDDYDSEDASECSTTFVEAVLESELKAAGNANDLILEEEREKNKAEKRRAKKKRRKEKKKLEKLEKDTSPEKNDSSNAKGPNTLNRSQDAKSSDSEEDLDTTSAFVAVIAKKQKKIPGLEIKDNGPRHILNPKTPKEDPHSVIFRSRQIALRGNEMASSGHYSEAAELFSESIKLDPSDHRFYGNRSYCYDRLYQFERALKDADKSIALCAVWPKGYFRKGRALLGLKKYALAEQCFIEVLKLDNDCEDAISELRMAKILQIMEKGYSKDHAEAAISAHSTVSEALSSLLSSGISRVHVKDDIFVSDDENDTIWKSVKKTKVADHLYDIKRDPNNPEGHNSLWIGNVQVDVTEKKLMSMFGKFGELLSVKVMPEKFCAFVNFKSKASPGKAMQAYQGYELSGTKLVIRFPNLPGETVATKKKPTIVGESGSQSKFQGPVNGNECYFWRTTGCIYGDQCHYQHIKDHKGIDKQKWQVA